MNRYGEKWISVATAMSAAVERSDVELQAQWNDLIKMQYWFKRPHSEKKNQLWPTSMRIVS
jgi:uncharacterized protein YccT (UPF0319 family)